MKHKLLIATATAALFAAPSIASAQNDSGWYLKGAAGYGTHADIDITGNVVGDVESEGDVALNLGLGYEFENNWRLELDGSTLFSDLGDVGQQPSSFAKLRTNALMLNAIYDFDDFNNWEPYVGAGVGIVRGDASVVAHDFLQELTVLDRNPACASGRNFGATPQIAAFSCEFSDRDTTLGYQLLAGLGYKLSDNLTWDTNYRYLDAASQEFEGNVFNTLDGTSQPGTIEFDDIGAHLLLTGFRYRFGGAAAPKQIERVAPPEPTVKCWDGASVFNAGQCPPEPRPDPVVSCWDGSTAATQAACPVQPTVTCWDGTLRYNQSECPVQQQAAAPVVVSGCPEQYRQEIIYYEFDKGQSAETRNAINRVLDIGQFCNVQGIRVVGHTDTSGSAAYNLGLSKRRANDALEELVRQGVSRNLIVSEGQGETNPFIDSGDGVREQLNRRTEVLLTLGNIDALISN